MAADDVQVGDPLEPIEEGSVEDDYLMQTFLQDIEQLGSGSSEQPEVPPHPIYTVSESTFIMTTAEGLSLELDWDQETSFLQLSDSGVYNEDAETISTGSPAYEEDAEGAYIELCFDSSMTFSIWKGHIMVNSRK